MIPKVPGFGYHNPFLGGDSKSVRAVLLIISAVCGSLIHHGGREAKRAGGMPGHRVRPRKKTSAAGGLGLSLVKSNRNLLIG